ncbi:BglII/BstYI family type II restriction endonuclease [Bacillus cereus]|uniref:BglII/BstYI family type II restriction endonuclease n=1 Tax=Bacillus cereus group TaxID=86661 RepID=UPI0024057FD1|nr:BglII/BstYI family type II restriction endonuclease [Bacillus cereus]MDA2210247.1 BglII/BstYI family type II restriction endonuclease [Bacillus cereus]MDA2221149.1 BglII/BstYI family type II restriction endonuclease [Bacillus cereus]MDF9475509.1 BglII/BstYI family type II restriction endonuclease [Bacillus cereus]MDF9497763.1 BglII/BstYI family type II restriction endonuclease [Bacillus cereus]MDF9514800.1 BglII/BstYI family type II restriction endonuclease [Bacillus cereus]
MGKELLPKFIRDNYVVEERRHACAILKEDFPKHWEEIIEVLTNFTLKESQITVGGGSKSSVASSFDEPFSQLGWVEKKFIIESKIDGEIIKSETHKLDCFKAGVGLEIEWNNKDTFFDRDLEKFRLLFDSNNTISVGVIITRSKDLQQHIFNPLGIGKKYGASTTHLGKLLPKLDTGGGGGCPILVFGIKSSLYEPDVTGVIPIPIPKGTRTKRK